MSKIGRFILAVSIVLTVYLVYLIGYFPIAVQGGMGYIFPCFYLQAIYDYQTLTNIIAAITILAWIFWGIEFVTQGEYKD